MKVEAILSTAQLATRGSFFLLLITLAVNLWLKNAPGTIYFLYLLPLVIFIPGIIRGEIRTLIWLGFVLLLYFAIAVGRMSNPEPLFLDIVELALIVILFSSASVTARVTQKYNLR
ncbi:MAG: DUF2069 domain-containing protein [Proteobacteria bacterium]|nr:DUF2069 domain-containing protein [Pseudomonadota bacterium]MDA1352041.1 DUF2069 domain-containing protein [Pseudomonadota bacterium]